MRRQLATIHGRTAAIAVSILLLGGVTAGAHATMQEASGTAALESEARAHLLAQKKAEILAASWADLLSDATRLLARARAASHESAGKVEEGLRAELDAAIHAVEAAHVDGDQAALLAAMRVLRASVERVEDATDAHDDAAAPVTPPSTPSSPPAPAAAVPAGQQPDPAAQQGSPPATGEQQPAGVTAERDGARVGAEQEAARVVAEQEAARLAAEQEAARLAAEQEGARVAAEQKAARLAAEQEAARVVGEQEGARLAAEQEAARVMAEQECGRLAAEQEAARLAVGAGVAPQAHEQPTPIEAVTPTSAPIGLAATSTPPAQIISGTLSVRQQADATMTQECVGRDRHAHLRAGAPVTVLDAQGVPVGTGQLSMSDGSSSEAPNQSSDRPVAVFTYTVPVTAVAEKYTIVVGLQMWEVIADAAFQTNGWQADLTVE